MQPVNVMTSDDINGIRFFVDLFVVYYMLLAPELAQKLF